MGDGTSQGVELEQGRVDVLPQGTRGLLGEVMPARKWQMSPGGQLMEGLNIRQILQEIRSYCRLLVKEGHSREQEFVTFEN